MSAPADRPAVTPSGGRGREGEVGEDKRAATIAEVERALEVLRREMAEAIRHGDDDLHVSLANRHGKLHGRRELLQRATAG